MKNFEVVIAEEPHFMRFTTVGNYAFEELFEFLGMVKIETVKHGHNNVLIDSRRLVGQMTEAERFAGGQKIAELFGARLRAALLMPENNITKLGELAAVNRGAQFFVTPSETEAINWLTA